MERRTITITLGDGAEPFDLEIIDRKSGKRYVLHEAFVSRSRVMGGAPVALSSSIVELIVEGSHVESFDLREEQSAANQTNPPNEPPPKSRGARRPPESYRYADHGFGFAGFGPFSTKSKPAGYSQEEHDEAERVRAAERERVRVEEAERRAEREHDRRASEARRARDDGWPEDMGGPFRGRTGASSAPGSPEDFFEWFKEAARGAAKQHPPRQKSSGYVEGWRTLLGMPETLKDAEKAFRKLALERHPDRGGTHEQMVELNAAMKAAREVLR